MMDRTEARVRESLKTMLLDGAGYQLLDDNQINSVVNLFYNHGWNPEIPNIAISLKRIADALVDSRLDEIANTVAKISDNVTAIERDR